MAIAFFTAWLSPRLASADRLLGGLLLSCCLLVSGCEGTPDFNAAAAPEGVVQVLTLDDEGNVSESPSTFQATVNRKDHQIVLVDFWAPWCGPCLQMSPQIEKVKQKWKDQVDVVKVNVDANPELAIHFQIETIPRVFVFRNGTVVKSIDGYTREAEFSAILTSLQ